MSKIYNFSTCIQWDTGKSLNLARYSNMAYYFLFENNRGLSGI
jgi:hypothetical protein